MTREQKIAKAKRLRDNGLTYGAVAEHCGVSLKTVRRWLIPGEAERSREASRAFKTRNRQAMHDYDREYNNHVKGKCSGCGGDMHRGSDGGVCLDCRRTARDKQARQIVEWWAENLTFPEIQERLGWSKGRLSVEIHRFREAGYDLPYRYVSGKRGGHRFPDQIPQRP